MEGIVVCVGRCACVLGRAGERQRQTDRQTDRQTESPVATEFVTMIFVSTEWVRN